MYGFYSQQYVDQGYSTSIYRLEDGSEVEVCFACETMESNSGWPDSVYVGKLKEYLRCGRINEYILSKKRVAEFYRTPF